MKFIPVLLLLLLPINLFSNMDPYTSYTDDRYFVTTGEIDFQISSWDVSMTLLKYNEYSLWALTGMQGVDKESEGLIVYFTDIEYSSADDLFYITFDLNLIWPFRREGVVLKFRPEQTFSNDGRLESIRLIPLLRKQLVEDAHLVFSISELPGGSSISYETRIRLTPFLDFFFSLRSYKKNFEWYVFKVTENLSEFLNEQYR